jgi:hypothetical protein
LAICEIVLGQNVHFLSEIELWFIFIV